MTEQIKEPLIGGQDFPYTPDQLSELFDPNNIKDLHEGTDVSEALHQLQNKFEGVDTLAIALRSDAKNGLREQTPAQRSSRESQYGKNTRKPRKIKTLCDLLCECFEDRILQILIGAAAISLIAGIYQEGWAHGWLDGTAIFLAVAIICSVTASQGWIKEKQFQELVKKQDLATAIVFRNNEPVTIDSEELQVGDILKVESGKACPADCVLVTSNQVLANESAQTGEPDELHKNAVTSDNYDTNPNPCLLQGSLIVNGEGRALVLAVGKHTQSGKAEQTLDIENEQTPLQAKLETIANEIGKVGLYVALLTFLALCVRLLIKILTDDALEFLDMNNLLFIIDALIIGITVVVVAVPEGLPLAVTIALSFSVQKMYEQKNLVRKLGASETMGGANEICTDKTGTLTQNNMTVMAIFMEDKIVEGSKYADFKQTKTHEEVQQSVLYNCSAFIETLETGEQRPQGNVTEVGLVKYLISNEVEVKTPLNSKDQLEEFTIPFNSKLKRAVGAYRKADGSGVRVFCKGAPEQVIELCDTFHGADGNVTELSQDKKASVVGEEVIKNFARRCFRTLLVAYRDFSDSEWAALKEQHNNFAEEEDKNTVVEKLTMAAIFGLMDPLRHGIKEAVKRCHKSGINIRMVTGDNVDTATAISLDAGIITQEDLDDNDDGYVCMLGKDFRETCGDMVTTVLDEEKGTTKMSVGNVKNFKDVCGKLKVLARSKPEDKFMLVTGLMEIFGAVVAVTGDGTNDVPALNKADVGFAMGIAGTDPAKNAADIVLVDDNFSSILVAVLYGRNIYDNVRKFLQFQLTVNVVAMFIVFSGAIIFADSPLTSVQMLWVNMIMDTFAALALATEDPDKILLERKPQSRKETIVNNVMWRNILGQSLYQITVCLCLLFVGPLFDWYHYNTLDVSGNIVKYEEKVVNEDFYCNDLMIDSNPGIICPFNEGTMKLQLYTMVFQAFVFMQLFNLINARKLQEREFNVFKGFFNNWYFLLIMTITLVVQVVLVQYGGRAVRCASLTMTQNGICIGIGSFSLIWGFVIKFIPSRWFDCLAIAEEPLDEEAQEKTIQAVFRKSATLSNRQLTRSGSQKFAGK